MMVETVELVEREDDIILRWTCDDTADGVLIIESHDKFLNHEEVIARWKRVSKRNDRITKTPREGHHRSQKIEIMRGKNDNLYITICPYNITEEDMLQPQPMDRWYRYHVVNKIRLHLQYTFICSANPFKPLKIKITANSGTLTTIPESYLMVQPIQSASSPPIKLFIPSYSLSRSDRILWSLRRNTTISLHDLRILRHLKSLLPATITWNLDDRSIQVRHPATPFYLDNLQIHQPELPSNLEDAVQAGNKRIYEVVGRVENWDKLPWRLDDLLYDFAREGMTIRDAIFQAICYMMQEDSQVEQQLLEAIQEHSNDSMFLLLEHLVSWNPNYLGLLEQLITDDTSLSDKQRCQCMLIRLNHYQQSEWGDVIDKWLKAEHTTTAAFQLLVQLVGEEWLDGIQIIQRLVRDYRHPATGVKALEFVIQSADWPEHDLAELLVDVHDERYYSDLRPIATDYILTKITTSPTSEFVHHIFTSWLGSPQPIGSLGYEYILKWYETTKFSIYQPITAVSEHNHLYQIGQLLYLKGSTRLKTGFSASPLPDTPINLLKLAGHIGNPALWIYIMPYLEKGQPENIRLQAIQAAGQLRTDPYSELPNRDQRLIQVLATLLNHDNNHDIHQAVLRSLTLVSSDPDYNTDFLVAQLETYMEAQGQLTEQVVDVIIHHQLLNLGETLSTDKWLISDPSQYFRLWKAIPFSVTIYTVQDHILKNADFNMQPYLPDDISEYAPFISWYFAERQRVAYKAKENDLVRRWQHFRALLIQADVLRPDELPQKPSHTVVATLNSRHQALKDDQTVQTHELQLLQNDSRINLGMLDVYSTLSLNLRGHIQQLKAEQAGAQANAKDREKANRELKGTIDRLRQLSNESGDVGDAIDSIQRLLEEPLSSQNMESVIERVKQEKVKIDDKITKIKRERSQTQAKIDQASAELAPINKKIEFIRSIDRELTSMMNSWNRIHEQIRTTTTNMDVHHNALKNNLSQIDQRLEAQRERKLREDRSKITASRAMSDPSTSFDVDDHPPI